MKKAVIIFTIIFSTHLLVAQIEPGVYCEKMDYISFSNDSVCFNLTNYGCFLTHIRGCGTFQQIEDYLFIETYDYKGIETTVEKSNNSDNSIDINIVGANDKPMVGVSIICEDSSGNMISGTTTDVEGHANIENQPGIEIIRILYLACDPIDFKYESNFDYKVNLVEGLVVEYQTVVFEIISISSEELELRLLLTDFNKKKDSIRSLKKVKRKIKKHKHSINILKKNSCQ